MSSVSDSSVSSLVLLRETQIEEEETEEAGAEVLMLIEKSQ